MRPDPRGTFSRLAACGSIMGMMRVKVMAGSGTEDEAGGLPGGLPPPPRFAADHPDYRIEYEEAVEPFVASLVERARASGWEASAVWPVLRSLVANLEQSEFENALTTQAIEVARLAKPT